MSITQFALAVSTITDAVCGFAEVRNDKIFFEDIMVNTRLGIVWLVAHIGLGLLGGMLLLAGLMFDGYYTIIGYTFLMPSMVISLIATNPETLTTMFHLALIQIAIIVDNNVYKCISVIVAIIIINGIRVKYPDNIAVILASSRTGIPLQMCYLSIATQLVAAMLLLIGYSASHYPSNAIAGVLLIPSIIGGFVVAYNTTDIFFFRLQYILLAVVLEILTC